MTTAAATTTAAREIRITTAAVAIAKTKPIPATTNVAVAVAMIPRRAARTQIRDREMMATTLEFAARWKAMAAQIAAIGLFKLKMAK
jgi:hypothetical protein